MHLGNLGLFFVAGKFADVTVATLDRRPKRHVPCDLNHAASGVFSPRWTSINRIGLATKIEL